MEGLFTQIEKSLDTMGQCAVAVTGNGGSTHSGLLIRFPDDPIVYLLHLQTDNLKLNDSAGCPTQCLWGTPDLPEDRLTDIAVKAILVQDVNKDSRIPYGFSVPGGFFDNETGKIILSQNNIGLTCATFILAVFHMARIQLIDYASWHKREGDRTAQEELADHIEKQAAATGISKDGIKAIKGQINGIRYRPEEVVAAAITSSEINTMAKLEPLGKKIVEKILQQIT